MLKDFFFMKPMAINFGFGLSRTLAKLYNYYRSQSSEPISYIRNGNIPSKMVPLLSWTHISVNVHLLKPVALILGGKVKR